MYPPSGVLLRAKRRHMRPFVDAKTPAHNLLILDATAMRQREETQNLQA